ncbi:MAG: hypothetical protein V4687_04760 [Bacteroidota bacterium]
MKKLLFLILCTTTLGLVSCKKDTIIQETSNRTIILNIQPNQWVSVDNGRGYTVDLNIPEIDQLNVDIEGILVYLDHPVNVNSYIQLPYVFSGSAYSYEQFRGGIAVDIQRSEFTTQNPTRPTVAIRVKVVLIPSDDVS